MEALNGQSGTYIAALTPTPTNPNSLWPLHAEYPIGSWSTPRHKVGTARTSSNSSAGSISLAPSASTPPASATVGSGATSSVSGSRSSFHFVLPSAASKLSKMIGGSRHSSVGKTHSTSSSLSSHSAVVPEAKVHTLVHCKY